MTPMATDVQSYGPDCIGCMAVGAQALITAVIGTERVSLLLSAADVDLLIWKLGEAKRKKAPKRRVTR